MRKNRRVLILQIIDFQIIKLHSSDLASSPNMYFLNMFKSLVQFKNLKLFSEEKFEKNNLNPEENENLVTGRVSIALQTQISFVSYCYVKVYLNVAI